MKKQIFKVGDKVYDVRYGWGEVTHADWREDYPIRVKFKDDSVSSYTHDGVWHKKINKPVLSFTEYTLQGFSQERPKPQPKVGEMCVFWDNNDTDNRRVVSKLERINKSYYDETDIPWDNCITLDEFYEQQKK